MYVRENEERKKRVAHLELELDFHFRLPLTFFILEHH